MDLSTILALGFCAVMLLSFVLGWGERATGAVLSLFFVISPVAALIYAIVTKD